MISAIMRNIFLPTFAVSSWKLSRSKSLADASRIAIDEVMNSVSVLLDQYYNVRGHSDDDCFYYPENNGGPVEIAGECAADTIAVNNFNMSSVRIFKNVDTLNHFTAN